MLRGEEAMRSAIHNLNILGFAAEIAAIPGTKKIVVAVQVLYFARKAIVLGRSARTHLRSRRQRCAAGSQSTDNFQPTTQE
jgi:hypothetical protein